MNERVKFYLDPAEPEAISPYKGLRFFDEADAPLFFGREQLTAELVDHLRQHRFLAVVGASGSGKSSVVRAGVIPAVRGGAIVGDNGSSATWPIHVITPGDEPLKALAVSLIRGSESVTAAQTLRADFYAFAVQLESLRPLLQTRQKIVGAMSQEELRQAIEGPAAQEKWPLQPGLMETTLQDVGRELGALPLLSHALQKTWARREGLRQRAIFLRGALVLATALAIVTLLLFARTSDREQEAERLRRVALTQLVVTESNVVLDRTNDSELATLLAIEGVRLNSGSGGNMDWLVDSNLRSHLATHRYFNNTLVGYQDRVNSVAFSPDGRTLASATYDGAIRLWPLLEELVEIGCQKVRRNLSWAEWQRYLPGEPYRQTCSNLPLHPSVLAEQR